MKFFLFSLVFGFFVTAEGSTDSISKGRSKFNAGGNYSYSGSQQNYRVAAAYNRFVSDRLTFGGLASVLGRTGDVLSGFGLGVEAEYYVLTNTKGALYLSLGTEYFTDSRKVEGLTSADKVTIWFLTVEAALGYDHFISKNIAITPEIYWSKRVDEKESDVFRYSESDGGIRFALTFFF